MVQKRMSFTDRKQAILEAAIPLFAQHGFNNTTTKEIAQCAGVSEALLYKHFNSKTQLFDCIKEQCCEGSQFMARRLYDMELGGKSIIYAVSLLGYSMVYGFDGEKELKMIRRLMMYSLLDTGDFVKKFNSHHFEIWFPRMIENMEEAIRLGQIDTSFKLNTDCFWFVHHVFASLGFYLLPQEKIMRYKSNEDEILEQSIIFCLRGLGLKNKFIKDNFDYKEIENNFINKDQLKGIEQ